METYNFATNQFSYQDALNLSRLIREHAQPGMVVFELGTYTGRSSLTMLPSIQRMNGRLFCVDWFRGSPEVKDPITTSYQERNVLDLFLSNVRQAGYEDHVTVLVGTTTSVASVVADESVDFLFVDADHRYSQVRQDLLHWYPKLKDGGLICGHDFDKHLEECDYQRVLEKCEEDLVDGCHYGVIRAVCEFFPDVQWEGRIWHARKGDYPRPLLHTALAENARVHGGAEKPCGCPGTGRTEFDEQGFLASLFADDGAYTMEEDYRGYNILLYRSRYYALAQALGPVELSLLEERTLSDYQKCGQCVIGNSLEEVKRRLDQLGYQGSPQLIEEGYQGYNLVLFWDRYYALAQALGPVDLTQTDQDTLRGYEEGRNCFIARSLEEVKHLVDQRDYQPGPGLVEEGYRGFHILRYQGLYYALAPTLRPLEDPTEGKCFVGRSVAEVKRLVDWTPRPEWKALFIADAPLPQARQILEQLPFEDLHLLAPDCQKHAWPGYVTISYAGWPGNGREEPNIHHVPADLREYLRDQHYDVVVVPYGRKLGSTPWEKWVEEFCPRLMGVFPHGKTRVYADQDLQRLLYNLAYLRSMWRWVPPAEGRAVLEVGCSDGLTCDLLANEGPAAMVGIDYWAGEGFTFRDPQVVYAQGDGHCLSFADQTFDLVYSIATLEHCRNPFAVLQEIQRVTRPGGYGYVQAGPLYYSPFGHHMFGFFDHYPWIHLRLSRDEIVAYCERTGLAREIERVRGTSAGEYIDSMLNAHHVNGKRLEEYGLQEFANSPGVEVIHFAPSYEGQDLLSPEIAAELGHLAPSDLIAHGFELVFRKVV